MNTIRNLIAVAVIYFAGLTFIRAADTNFNSVTLVWNANTETDIAGYRLFFSKAPEAWTHVKPLGLVTTATIELPEPGTWFFILTAKNTTGLELLPSNMIEYTTPTGPLKPGLLRIVSAVATQVSTVTTSTNIIIIP